MIANWPAKLPDGVARVIASRDREVRPQGELGGKNVSVVLADADLDLAAARFSTGLTSANWFLEQTEAGQPAINVPTAGRGAHQAFGGFRESGFPFNGTGAPGLRFHARTNTTEVRCPW